MAGAGRAEGQAHGTLTKKIARHWLPRTSADTSTPPRTWPATAPIDSAIAYSPIARTARPLEGQLDAGQRPGEHECGAGALQHARGDQRDRPGARPQSSEAPVKTPTPSRNTAGSRASAPAAPR
jgi:hypothetical protein